MVRLTGDRTKFFANANLIGGGELDSEARIWRDGGLVESGEADSGDLLGYQAGIIRV